VGTHRYNVGIEISKVSGFNGMVPTFGVELGLKLRSQRKGETGAKATYPKTEGCWCYFCRALDKEGDLIDVYLSDVRDQAAAEVFFKQAQKTTEITPKQITTNKEKTVVLQKSQLRNQSEV
jgi:transposase-like protein